MDRTQNDPIRVPSFSFEVRNPNNPRCSSSSIFPRIGDYSKICPDLYIAAQVLSAPMLFILVSCSGMEIIFNNIIQYKYLTILANCKLMLI